MNKDTLMSPHNKEMLELLDHYRTRLIHLSPAQKQSLSLFLEKFIANRSMREDLIKYEKELNIHADTRLLLRRLLFLTRHLNDLQSAEILSACKTLKEEGKLDEQKKLTFRTFSILYGLASLDKIPKELMRSQATKDLNHKIEISQQVLSSNSVNNKLDFNQLSLLVEMGGIDSQVNKQRPQKS